MSRSLSFIGGIGAGVRFGRASAAACESEADRRARRVTVLVLATALLGLFDLAYTLTYLQSTGMVELNPLARFMIAVGGAGQLVRFKLLTIALSSGLLYLIRRRPGAERCAWISLAALVLLSLHWVNYIQNAEKIGPTILAESALIDHRWIAITE